MKKTLLITLDFPPRIGGVARYWEKLCSRLPGDKIVVLAPREDKTSRADLNQSYKIYRKKLIATFPLLWPKWLLLIFRVKQIIKKENIEQILVGQILPVGTVALLAKKLWRIPYLVSSHAMDITILKKSWRKAKLAKKILTHALKIITVSNFTLQQLVKLGARKEKITIISPATDIFQERYPDRKKEIKKRYDLEGKKVLLTIGRIVERKGHFYVLKSLPRVLQRHPNTIYLIGSRGPFEEVLKRYASIINLENKVIFTGEISQKELPSFYRLCDIFLMPSIELSNGDVEGFGMVYLEASAFGKPVIASRSGGIQDAVIDNETGLLVDPQDTEALSQAITKILEDKELAEELGEGGKKRVREQFSWDTRTKKLAEVLS